MVRSRRSRRWRRLGCVMLIGFAVVGLYLLYRLITWPDVAGLAQATPETTAFIETARLRDVEVHWRWVPYADISDNLKRAVLVAEDMSFFSHNGFDTHELQVALREAVQRKRVRGASTITQQLAKNLWLSPSRSPLRKIEEAILTRQLEHHLEKRRILELYLNVVEFGPGLYGAEAAAIRYFGRPAGDPQFPTGRPARGVAAPAIELAPRLLEPRLRQERRPHPSPRGPGTVDRRPTLTPARQTHKPGVYLPRRDRFETRRRQEREEKDSKFTLCVLRVFAVQFLFGPPISPGSRPDRLACTSWR